MQALSPQPPYGYACRHQGIPADALQVNIIQNFLPQHLQAASHHI